MAKSVKKAGDSPAELIIVKLPPSGAPLPRTKCEAIANSMDEYFTNLMLSKVNKMVHCDEEGHDKGCGCGGGSGSSKPKVDLIVLIDTSGSMGTIAASVSSAADSAVDKAKKSCESDLKVDYLGVHGTWSGTKFTTNHKDYIIGIQGTGVLPLSSEVAPVGYNQESGANAIQDLSKYADWREGACRAIFYISDEELDSFSPRGDVADENAATLAAINEAKLNNVTIFAHHLTYQHSQSGNWPNTVQNYTDLCVETGGEVFFSAAADEAKYIELLEKVICSACGGCKSLEIPNASPCFSVTWGDSDCDCMETNDFEVLTITACNCYSNISFENLMIGQIILTDPSGKPVALLPDGSPSVEIHPPGGICFGTLGPCVDNTPSCKTREIVLHSRGAIAGKYQLKFEGICFSIAYAGRAEACFSFNLCKD